MTAWPQLPIAHIIEDINHASQVPGSAVRRSARENGSHPTMAISDFHASTIVKVRAYFGFDNFDCDPDTITRFLGIQPDKVGIKGAIKVVRAGREIRWPCNSWSLASRAGSKDINEHLRELIARLANVAPNFPPEFGQPSFSVLWKGNYLYAGSGPFFEPDVIAGVARLKASLHQDIYQVDEGPKDTRMANASQPPTPSGAGE